MDRSMHCTRDRTACRSGLLVLLFLAGMTILSNPTRAQEAALPPDDSAYIIFIIDTSGSMFNHVWPMVLEKVEETLAAYGGRISVRSLYNPFHTVSDNLASCWLAGSEMDEDFLLLNGDTLCEPGVVKSLLPLRAEIARRTEEYALAEVLAGTVIHLIPGEKRHTVRGGAALVLQARAGGAAGRRDRMVTPAAKAAGERR